jgi:hypothetical protein
LRLLHVDTTPSTNISKMISRVGPRVLRIQKQNIPIAVASGVCRGAIEEPRRRLTLLSLFLFCFEREYGDNGPDVWAGHGDCSDGAAMYRDRKGVINDKMMQI